jgi:hypothetical protein
VAAITTNWRGLGWIPTFHCCTVKAGLISWFGLQEQTPLATKASPQMQPPGHSLYTRDRGPACLDFPSPAAHRLLPASILTH